VRAIALGVSSPAGSELDSDVGSDAADSDDPEELGGGVGNAGDAPTGLSVESGGRAAAATGERPKAEAMAGG